MKQVLYLTAAPEGRGPVFQAVTDAAQAIGYSVISGNSSHGLRGGWLPRSGYEGDLRHAFSGSELVVAHVSRNNENLIYELGVATGVGKPVVLVVKNAVALPFVLGAMPAVSYDPRGIEAPRLTFSLCEIIKKLTQTEVS